tara:strand:- start:106 stop:519 length:414 start_codon:yes stop_codon:yes gene_type:complete
MKKIFIIILFFINFWTYGQNNKSLEKKTEIFVKQDVKKGLGFSYQGSGIYTLGKKGKLRNNPKYFKKNIIELEKNTIGELKKFTKKNNYDYEIISSESTIDFYNYTHINESYPKILITFKVFNKDGSLALNKEDKSF